MCDAEICTLRVKSAGLGGSTFCPNRVFWPRLEEAEHAKSSKAATNILIIHLRNRVYASGEKPDAGCRSTYISRSASTSTIWIDDQIASQHIRFALTLLD
jgi:hypothetical protein